MAQRKTERLMNLVFLLLSTEQYLTRDQIRAAIADYREASDVGFERQFERDKNELRDLGIEIETGSHDALGGHVGYRLQRSEVELPQIELTAQEAAVIGLAARLWDHAGLAVETTTALTKLKSIGTDIDPKVLRLAEVRLTADEPAFDDVFEATSQRVPIRFEYRRRDGETSVRHVQPWGMTSYRDRWYVSGFDRDRGEPRLFRLSRIIGDVVAEGPAGSYVVPDEVDVAATARALHPPAPDATAVLRITPGRAHSLRRQASQIESVFGDMDVVTVPFAVLADLADEITGYGPDVVVDAPAPLRDAVVERLRRVAKAVQA